MLGMGQGMNHEMNHDRKEQRASHVLYMSEGEGGCKEYAFLLLMAAILYGSCIITYGYHTMAAVLLYLEYGIQKPCGLLWVVCSYIAIR